MDGQLQRAPGEPRRGNTRLALGQLRDRENEGRTGRDHGNEYRSDNNPALQLALLIMAGAGRRVAMWSPGSTPDETMACSRPRRLTSTRVWTNSEPSRR